MPKQVGTLGELMIDQVLPQDMKGSRPILDKKGVSKLLGEVAANHPEKYRDISFKLNQIGREAAFTTGGNSFGLSDMRKAASARKLQQVASKKIDDLLNDDSISDEERDKRIIKVMGDLANVQTEAVYKESLDENNPLAIQLLGAGRGNKTSLSSLRGSDALYSDHREETIPIPVFKSYSQGLDPISYWASSYGARQGVLSSKLSVQKAGYLGKQLNQLAHRFIITAVDRDHDPETVRGLPVDVNDEDSEGALLALPIGGYKKNTVITPKLLSDLRKKGIKRLLVRSPVASGSPEGGIYSRDVGIREFGKLPVKGENVGMTAAQALSEGISQMTLASKHRGGVAGTKTLGGFQAVDALVQSPEVFPSGATHALHDGRVESITAAPAGGHFIKINGEQHYVEPDFNPTVKVGDFIEAGDTLSDGIPSPRLITEHKGIGQGRAYFVQAYKKALQDAGLTAHRRNVELLARGLINHVQLRDELGERNPDEIVPYSVIEHDYEPREGTKQLPPKASLGKYLEKPYLHYTIGTKVRKSMLKDFDDFGIKNIHVHEEEPLFVPVMIRGAANLQYDPDPMVRMFGSGLKSNLMEAVHLGEKSTELGTSFVPGRARAVDFGRVGLVRSPKRE